MKYLLNKHKILLLIWLPFFTFILFITLYKTSYSVVTTGDITNLDDIYSIDGGYDSSGSFNSVFVYSTDKISLFQKWATSLDDNAYLYIPTKNYSLFSTSELNKMGVIQKNQSVEAAIIKAYNEASLTDETISLDYTFKGLIVEYIIKSDNQQFEIGDIITSINGVTAADGVYALESAYLEMYEGSEVVIKRGSSEKTLYLNAESCLYYNADGHLRTHISYLEKYNVDYKNATPALSISSINTSGPSAGLMQTLAIYNMLVQTDLTNGKRIAGTGTIDVSGNVGEIGGIEQKVVAAFKNKCDIFLCPKDNYEDGYRQYKKLGSSRSRMKFVEVSSFADAVEVLLNA